MVPDTYTSVCERASLAHRDVILPDIYICVWERVSLAHASGARDCACANIFRSQRYDCARQMYIFVWAKSLVHRNMIVADIRISLCQQTCVSKHLSASISRPQRYDCSWHIYICVWANISAHASDMTDRVSKYLSLTEIWFHQSSPRTFSTNLCSRARTFSAVSFTNVPYLCLLRARKRSVWTSTKVLHELSLLTFAGAHELSLLFNLLTFPIFRFYAHEIFLRTVSDNFGARAQTVSIVFYQRFLFFSTTRTNFLYESSLLRSVLTFFDRSPLRVPHHSLPPGADFF